MAGRIASAGIDRVMRMAFFEFSDDAIMCWEEQMDRQIVKIRIPPRAMRDILRFAKDASIKKLVLFGSRARGTSTEYSDIDLAVYGGDFDQLFEDIQEKTWSLLTFDLINMDEKITADLAKEIQRDGVMIYEKD
jgi:predicted nucleotidyltransferase